MKEFNIKLAKQGKPVCTRDGKPARIICFDRETDLCPIVALIKINGTEQVFSYHKDGKYVMSEKEHSLDLMMAVEKKTMYVNIYKCKNDDYIYGRLFSTREIAISSADNSDYVATAEINWEE